MHFKGYVEFFIVNERDGEIGRKNRILGNGNSIYKPGYLKDYDLFRKIMLIENSVLKWSIAIKISSILYDFLASRALWKISLYFLLHLYFLKGKHV